MQQKIIIRISTINKQFMKKQIILTFFLLKVLIISAQTVIYPYRVEPSKFPDYNRRTFLAPAPTESFQDTVRFIGERYVKPARTNLFYGDFYWLDAYSRLYRRRI